MFHSENAFTVCESYVFCRLKHHNTENSDNGNNRDEEEDTANIVTDLGPIEYPKGLQLFFLYISYICHTKINKTLSDYYKTDCAFLVLQTSNLGRMSI